MATSGSDPRPRRGPSAGRRASDAPGARRPRKGAERVAPLWPTVEPLDQEPIELKVSIPRGRNSAWAAGQVIQALAQLVYYVGLDIWRSPSRCRRALRAIRRHRLFPIVCWLLGTVTGGGGVAVSHVFPFSLLKSLFR